jgi:hypothetical protein
VSKRFYLLAVGLLLLTLVGLMLVVTLYEADRRAQNTYNQTADCMCETSPALETAIHATETAKAFTNTPAGVTK